MKANEPQNKAPAKVPPVVVQGIPMPVDIKSVETSSKHDSAVEARTQTDSAQKTKEDK